MIDYGLLTLVPTGVVLVLALWTHRTIESLLAGTIVGLFILEPAAHLPRPSYTGYPATCMC